jgi:hypothetical protein
MKSKSAAVNRARQFALIIGNSYCAMDAPMASKIASAVRLSSFAGRTPVSCSKSGRMAETHTGGCYCGAVEIEVRGDPLEMGYCHCENCRRYSAAPVSAFTLWKKEDVNVTKGEEFLGRFKSSDISERGYCTKCGGHILVEHPTLGLMDVRIGALPNFPFKPRVHLNYAETILPIRDGLPKLKDFPAAIGGSGETIPE